MAATKKTRERTGRAAASQAAPVTAAVAATSGQAAVPSVDLARSFFNAALAPCHGMLRFLAQMRTAQADLLLEMDQALSATLRQAEGAADLQELVRLHSDLASDNLGRTAQAANTLFRNWLDAEAEVLEQAQAQGADVTRKLMHEAPSPASGNGGAASDVVSGPALALLNNAQAAWSQMTQQWLEAVNSTTGPH